MDAELPTEPTELADPVEETEGEEEAGAEDGAEGGEEQEIGRASCRERV